MWQLNRLRVLRRLDDALLLAVVNHLVDLFDDLVIIAVRFLRLRSLQAQANRES